MHTPRLPGKVKIDRTKDVFVSELARVINLHFLLKIYVSTCRFTVQLTESAT